MNSDWIMYLAVIAGLITVASSIFQLYTARKNPQVKTEADLYRYWADKKLMTKIREKRINKNSEDSEIDLASLIIDSAEREADIIFQNEAFLEIDITNLSVESLINFHKSFFPKGYPNVGLRNVEVMISSSEGTVVNSQTDTVLKPISPELILKSLDDLCKRWNDNFQIMKKAELEEKLKWIASFHYDFIAIHPFLDGNGRVARALLKLQIEALTDKKIDITKFKEFQDRYFDSLREANKGKNQKLFQFIKMIISL